MLAAPLFRPTGDVYVSVYTTAAYGVGAANKNRVFTLLDVVEVKPMQTGQVVVDANAMAREIAASASNRAEDGRAKNRRVGLVAW